MCVILGIYLEVRCAHAKPVVLRHQNLGCSQRWTGHPRPSLLSRAMATPNTEPGLYIEARGAWLDAPTDVLLWTETQSGDPALLRTA
eukprot:scaffold23871_cov67-Phaeocystis_antarctica.AAC.2